MAINTAPHRTLRQGSQTIRLSFLRRVAAGAVLLTLVGTQAAQAQCSGSGGGLRTAPAGGTGGFIGGGLAGVGTFTNGAASLGQVQQMGVLMRQQARAEQQQRMALLQRQQAFAAARQRQAWSQRTASHPIRTRDRVTHVEAAQRRRTTYLRMRREQNADAQPIAVASTDG